MDRRAAGLAVLVFAVITALLLPVLGGRRVPGKAERSVTPDPPQVGDCLGSLLSHRSSMEFGQPVFAETTRPCDESNIGEVVALDSNIHFSPPTLDNGITVVEPVHCDPFVRDYLGWPNAAADGGAGPSITGDTAAWQPPDTLSAGILGPDLSQYLAGQRWVACVVYPEYGPYPGSIRDSVQDGHGANTFGSCLTSSDPGTAQKTSCAEPHQTEVFGSTRVNAGDDTANLEESCTTLARRITGMSDPTADGDLTVAVIKHGRELDDGSPLTAKPPAQDQVDCSVIAGGTRRLVSTLIGIGDRSLPWQ